MRTVAERGVGMCPSWRIIVVVRTPARGIGERTGFLTEAEPHRLTEGQRTWRGKPAECVPDV